MSQKARKLIAYKLNSKAPDPIVFDELKEELENELGVKWNTAQNYIYDYCQYEKRHGTYGGAKVVYDMVPKYQNMVSSEVGKSSTSDFEPTEVSDLGSIESETSDKDDSDGDNSDEDESLNVADLEEPVPEKTGDTYQHLPVREEGHQMVPDVRSYLKRPMGGSDVSVNIDKSKSAIEVVAKSMDSEDYGTLMIGEPGTGKGHMVRKICSETNHPMVRVNFGSRITKEKLVGGYVPRANGDGLDAQIQKAEEMASDTNDLSVGEALETLNVREKFVWKDGLLTKAVRHGWVFLADELNAAPPETLMPLHGLLEDASNRSLELTEKGEVVDVHDSFKFVGTMNPPHHPGTKRLNDALMGRLIPIEIPYLEPDAEANLLQMRTEVSSYEAEDLVELAQDLRSSYPNDIQTPCTPRELLKIAEMAEMMSLKSASRMVLKSMADTENEKDAIQKRIDMSF